MTRALRARSPMSTSPSSSPPSRVVIDDLRGVRVHAATDPVLLDRSGERARRLRIAGRIVGLLFLGWLCGLVLAGLGLLPAAGVPLGSVVAAASAPPVLRRAPVVRAPARADLAPAQTLAEVRAGTAARILVPPGTGTNRTAPSTTTGATTATGRRANGKAKRKPTAPAAAPAVTAGPGNGKGANNGRPAATGVTTTSPTTPATAGSPGTVKGNSTSAPGRTKTTTPTTTTTTTTTTTAPGASGSAPGHGTTSPGQGNGNGHGHTKTTP